MNAELVRDPRKSFNSNVHAFIIQKNLTRGFEKESSKTDKSSFPSPAFPLILN
jgi:hypothetical protein